MSELMVLSNDLNVITAEINSYKNVAGQAIFEIGRRLKHVKEHDLAHGQFESWLESNVSFSTRQARRFIQAYEDFKTDDVVRIGTSKIFEVLSLPSEIDRQEFIEQKHTVPSTGEQKTVDEMTVRELREVKKALKEARKQVEAAKRSEQIALKQLEELENQEPQVIEKVVERVIQDETKIQRLEHELYQKQILLQQIEQQKKQLENKMKQERQDAENFRSLKHDLDQLQSERESVIRQIESAGTIGKFIARIEKSFEEDLAPVKYTRAIQETKDSEAVLEAVDKIVSRVEKWCKEIRSVMPSKHYIEAEVVEYE